MIRYPCKLAQRCALYAAASDSAIVPYHCVALRKAGPYKAEMTIATWTTRILRMFNEIKRLRLLHSRPF